MAISTPFSPLMLAAVAAQVSRLAAVSGYQLVAQDAPQIGETLSIYFLSQQELTVAAPLALATPTGSWHHQVYRGDQPTMAVHSRPLAPGAEAWGITAVFAAGIPEAIDRAIAVADAELPGDGEARLLIVPSHDVQALWIARPSTQDSIIPAVVPQGYGDAIPRLAVMSADDFFARLRPLPARGGIRVP